MYRCGNNYQDRPCDAAQPGKVVNTTGAGVAAPPRPAITNDCAQRGEAAQKIAWVRETGQTEAMQLASGAGGPDAALISEVYRRSGSAAQVRSAVEADCMAEADRAAQRAAALGGLANGTPGAPAPGSKPIPASMLPPDEAEAKAQAKQRADEETRAAAASKKARCTDLVMRLDTIRQSQRMGGDASAIENLKQQYRNAEIQVRSAGC